MHLFKKIKTTFGFFTIIASDAGVEAILFNNEKIPKKFKEIKEDKNHKIILQCEKELNEYFEGKRKKFTVKLNLIGTDFQKEVWACLLKIPYGKTISYKEESIMMKNPKAIRAIASANGKNSIPIIIPCHRVIGSNNHLDGYAGGLLLKQRLLEHEGLVVINSFVQVKST